MRRLDWIIHESLIEQAAVRQNAQELGITERELRDRIDQERLERWRDRQAELDALEAEKKPKRDAVYRAIGEAAGLEVPLGIRRRRRRDSHYHLIAVEDGCVKGRMIRACRALCATAKAAETPFRLHDNELVAAFSSRDPIDPLGDDRSPEEWLEMATCKRCRKIAGLV